MTNIRTDKLPPLNLTGKAKIAYSALTDHISMLSGIGVKVPCMLKPLAWDIDESRRRDFITDRLVQRLAAESAINKCKNECQALRKCIAYKKTGVICSGILAGEWLGASKYRNKPVRRPS